MKSCLVAGRDIEYARLPSAHPRQDAPAIVFLHEGLGSLAMWRDFPQQIADATGCEAVVYSRYGYGRSAPLREQRRPDFMHDEALAALPELLGRLGIARPILLGHSDGASIALIHAGAAECALMGASTGAPTAVIAMAPHVLVEDISIRSIRQAREAFLGTDLGRKLAKYHAEPETAFWGWNDIWLDPAFRDWNIESFLPRIACPILAMQGEDDEYGTMDQIERIARQARDVELVKLADCRHSPHKDQPAAVIAAVAAFVGRVLD